MIEVARAILEDNGKRMAFADIVNAVQKYLNKSDEEIRERLPQFYTNMNTDGEFISMGENVWALRSWFPYESVDEEVNHPEDEEEDDSRKHHKKVNAFLASATGDDDIIDYDNDDPEDDDLDATDDDTDDDYGDEDSDYDEDNDDTDDVLPLVHRFQASSESLNCVLRSTFIETHSLPLESLAVTGLVAGHLVHGVMDRVEVVLLRELRQLELACGRAVLSVNTHLEVLLGGVGQDFAQQLSKLRSVLRFLVSRLLPVQADLRVALAVRNARHCQVHANLGALTLEVLAQALHNLLRSALRYADNVLCRPGLLASLLLKLFSRSVADRALSRSRIALMYITAYSANKLLHDFSS